MTNQEIGVACTQTHMLSVCLVNRLHLEIERESELRAVRAGGAKARRLWRQDDIILDTKVCCQMFSKEKVKRGRLLAAKG